MNKLRIFVVLLFLAPALIFAQAAKAGTAAPAVEPSALIAYADDPGLVTILGTDGSSRTPDIGDELAPGETLKSAGSTVELKLSPNGSILKIAKNTVFKLDGLQGKAGQTSNAISVIGGKIRTVAAKAAAGNSYQFRTSTAVCGVRGTDFTLVVEQGLRDAVFVQKGLVDFAKLDPATGAALQSVAVAAGQFADAIAETFAAADFTADQFPDVFDSDTQFVSLNPADVPEDIPAEAAPVAPPEAAPVAPPEAAPAAEAAAQPATPDVKAQAESKLMLWLRETLGMQIGSITINGLTYSQAILQPTFAIGKLKMSLYLPIIYSSNLFDPKDWYHPKGNDEWSFGVDKGWNKNNWKEAALDAASDLALKIRYIEWGKQLVDPFYLKIGNLHDMTIGHGVIMNNFANDADFPAVRRVGFNMGFEVGKFGLESVVNDLSNPEIFGVRPYVRPAKWLGFGFSAIADINPASDFKKTQSNGTVNATVAEQYGDPVFLGLGLDAELPIVKSAAFSLIPFADIAGMAPYLRTSIPWVSASTKPDGQGEGFQSWLLLPNGLDLASLSKGMPFRNCGIAAGLIGNIAVFNFRFEYRNYNGIFKPSFYDTLYERNRSQYVKEYYDYLTGAKDIAQGPTVDGIYGEGSMSIMSDKIKVLMGYMMPFSSDKSVPLMNIMKNDFFKLSFSLAKGTIPKLDVAGSISYERRGLAYTFFKGKPANVTLFDENTVFKGEFAYPVAPMIDLAAVISTAAQRDPSGNVVYETTGNTKIVPVIAIETRVHF